MSRRPVQKTRKPLWRQETQNAERHLLPVDPALWECFSEFLQSCWCEILGLPEVEGSELFHFLEFPQSCIVHCGVAQIEPLQMLELLQFPQTSIGNRMRVVDARIGEAPTKTQCLIPNARGRARDRYVLGCDIGTVTISDSVSRSPPASAGMSLPERGHPLSTANRGACTVVADFRTGFAA
jgi:hypothetical protein